MNAPNAWRGADRWGRRGSQPLGLQAGEVASYRRPPRALALIGPALTILALFILAYGVLR
jgi:hypothetical protein